MTHADAPKNDNHAADCRSDCGIAPAVDIYETETGLTLIADLPGVSREKLTLTIEAGVLSLVGCGPTCFRRQFQLPEALDLEQVQAALQHGVLTLHLPKAAAAQPRKIEVTIH